LLDGDALRLGSVDKDRYTMGVQRTTGHFGYVIHESRKQSWVFCNTSVKQLLECHAAMEHLWQMEQTNQISWVERGAFLEREIRRIDPGVFSDDNNMWSFLVEELHNGVV